METLLNNFFLCTNNCKSRLKKVIYNRLLGLLQYNGYIKVYKN